MCKRLQKNIRGQIIFFQNYVRKMHIPFNSTCFTILIFNPLPFIHCTNKNFFGNKKHTQNRVEKIGIYIEQFWCNKPF